MTTKEMPRITATARRFRPMWRHAGGRSPAPEAEHELAVLSRHRTSEGIVTYARCTCGELQIWLAGASRPAHTLIKSIPGPQRPPA
jgi:phosphoribosylcarboxyaminoimidazole (NCAIR) mutase